MSAQNLENHHRKKAARILIVDDQPLARLGLRTLLASQPGIRVCGEAGDCQRALRAIAKKNPALVTVEIMVKGSSGLELIKEIRLRFPKVKLLVVSSQDAVLYAERALRAGALAFVHKHEALAQVGRAVKAALCGDIYVSKPITARLASRMAGRPYPAATIADILTDRELQIFGMIGEGHGPNKIGAQLSINKSTVETYRNRIKKKLRFHNAAQMRQEAIMWKHGVDMQGSLSV